MKFFTKLFLILFLGMPAWTQERIYEDQIFYHQDMDDVAYFLGEVQYGSDLILKRALQSEPQTKMLVLISHGGSMYGGLRASAVIRQSKLDTYVPKKSICASACSSMLFAGVNRWVNGNLGVHQFRSGDDKRVLAGIKEVQADTQFLTSDVITILSDYDLPDFVVPRMLATHWSEMHWFNSTEKKLLMNRNTSQLSKDVDCIERVTDFWVNTIYLEEEAVMPRCAQAVETDRFDSTQSLSIETKMIRPGTYKLENCQGNLTNTLNLGSITVSEHRDRFNGRNAMISDVNGIELMFGNPRLYHTDSGNLISEKLKESILTNGSFEPIGVALTSDDGNYQICSSSGFLGPLGI